jgi:hypothetical protein
MAAQKHIKLYVLGSAGDPSYQGTAFTVIPH